MNSWVRAWLARRGPLAPAALALVTMLLVNLGRPPDPSLCLLGDARDYLNGIIAPALRETEFDASALSLGVGRAALGDWGNLGEALLAGGQMYVRSTALGTPGYYRVLHDTRFKTSAFAYLAADTPARAQQTIADSRSLAQWRQALIAQYPGGVLVAGTVRFARLSTIAVSRPAIDGYSPRRRPALFYTEPREDRADVWSYVVGVVVRQPLFAGQSDDPMLVRLLAPYAHGRTDNLIHALILDEAPADPRTPPRPEQVVSLGRVTNDSVIAEAWLDVYPLYRLAPCEPPPADVAAAPPANGTVSGPATTP